METIFHYSNIFIQPQKKPSETNTAQNRSYIQHVPFFSCIFFKTMAARV